MKTKEKVFRFIFLAAFCAVFFCLFAFFSEIFREKTSGDVDRVRCFYELKEDSIDVLALGSSHTFCSFQPNVLWKESGLTSYSLATPQQTVACSYFLLKEALRTQKPRVVILDSYYFFKNRMFVSDARLRQAIDPIKFSKTKVEIIDEALPDLSLKEKMTYYIPFVKYHGRWNSLGDYDFNTKPYLKGVRLETNVSKNQDPGLEGITKRKIPELNVRYLDKMMELCEQNGIQLVVYAAPFNRKKSSYENCQGVNLSLAEYLKERGIPFLFFQRDGQISFDWSEDFMNSSHLNYKGAEKTTKYLGEYFIQHFGLESHRDDPAYESWDKDYELFLEDLKAAYVAGAGNNREINDVDEDE